MAQFGWPALAFVLGLVFGSFANVVIWRYPRGESLSFPPSRCPACEHPIAWYDNVPVLSWLVLRGRCRGCGGRISARYPVVELSSGLLWLLALVLYGPTLRTLFAIAFFYLLLILAMIDLDTYRLPNALVGLLAGVGVAGVITSFVAGTSALPLLLAAEGPLSSPVLFAVLGAVAASGLSLGIALVYERTRKREGFGMGDVKLLAAMGPFLGLYTLLVLFAASVIGAFVGVAAARRSPDGLAARVPFGPFLALGAVIVTVFGPAAWDWYASLLA
ncbi:MAG: prepilin peptidase [Coriobacteriia bacterium]|nr:prepilin peptidase [Coriobacteriia bacterium]